MADIQRIESSARISRAVLHHGIAYLAGQTAVDRSGDIRAQTRDVLTRIDARLTQVGTDTAARRPPSATATRPPSAGWCA